MDLMEENMAEETDLHAAVYAATAAAEDSEQLDAEKGPGFLELLQSQLQAIRDGTVKISQVIPSLAASAESSSEDAHLVQLHERVRAATAPVTLRAAVESSWPVESVEPTAEMIARSAKEVVEKEGAKKAVGVLVRLKPQESISTSLSSKPSRRVASSVADLRQSSEFDSAKVAQPPLAPVSSSKDDWPDVYGDRVLAIEVTCFNPVGTAAAGTDAFVPITQEMRATSAAIIEHLRLSMARKIALRHAVNFAAEVNVKREFGRYRDEERGRDAERRGSTASQKALATGRSHAQTRATARGQQQQPGGAANGTIAFLIAEAKAEAASQVPGPGSDASAPVVKSQITLTTMKAVERFRSMLSREKAKAKVTADEFLPLDVVNSPSPTPRGPQEIILPPSLNLVPPPLPWSVVSAPDQTRNLADAFAIPRTVSVCSSPPAFREIFLNACFF